MGALVFSGLTAVAAANALWWWYVDRLQRARIRAQRARIEALSNSGQSLIAFVQDVERVVADCQTAARAETVALLHRRLYGGDR